MTDKKTCIWCGEEGVLVPGKKYCVDCDSNKARECVGCHRPYPSLKAFEGNNQKCNTCIKKMQKAKQKTGPIVVSDEEEEEEEEEQKETDDDEQNFLPPPPKKSMKQPTLVEIVEKKKTTTNKKEPKKKTLMEEVTEKKQQAGGKRKKDEKEVLLKEKEKELVKLLKQVPHWHLLFH